jgi:hypothetical protein
MGKFATGYIAYAINLGLREDFGALQYKVPWYQKGTDDTLQEMLENWWAEGRGVNMDDYDAIYNAYKDCPVECVRYGTEGQTEEHIGYMLVLKTSVINTTQSYPLSFDEEHHFIEMDTEPMKDFIRTYMRGSWAVWTLFTNHA